MTALVLAKIWTFNGTLVALAHFCEGDLTRATSFERRLSGTLYPQHRSASQFSIALNEYRGETEVYYGVEDGERLVLCAGEPIGSGCGLARSLAANSTVVELHADFTPPLGLFSTEHYSPRWMSTSMRNKVTALGQLPDFRTGVRNTRAEVDLMHRKMIELYGHPGPDWASVEDEQDDLEQFKDIPLAEGDWYRFTHFSNQNEWVECPGAISWSNLADGSSLLVTTSSHIADDTMFAIGCYCNLRQKIVVIAERF